MKAATIAALEKVKQNKTVTAIVTVAILATLVYFFRDKLFGKKMPDNESYIKTDASSSSPSSNAKPDYSEDVDEMMKIGSSGEDVKELQIMINNKIRKTIPDASNGLLLLNSAALTTLLTVDGKFGKKTEDALYRYTKLRSITLAQARQTFARFK